ncbi:MAG: zinc ribbon domain-containing protein [Candidatus Eremiobacterota bacterium]
MFCQKCGHENTDDCIFCVSCGENLENQTEEETIKVDFGSSSRKTDKSELTDDENIPPEKEEKTPTPTDNNSDSSGTENMSTNPFAVISLIIPLITVLSCCGTFIPFLGTLCFIVFLLLSLLGLSFGIAGKIQVSRSEAPQKGSGIALAGIIINSLFLLLFILYIIVAVIFGVGLATLPMMLENIK